jgi:TRAP-type mannitol/chloroaromatic compound transport system permease small subunit
MAVTDEAAELPRFGEPAPVIRIFGWSILGVMVAYLINNFLIIGYGFTPISGILVEGGSTSIIPVLVYLVALAAVGVYVARTGNTSLRWDARTIHNFNKYLIRAFFWTVLMTGLVDASLAFLRVEKILPTLVNEQLAIDLGRSHFVGPYIHIPLVVLGFVIAAFTRTLGFSWLALMIVGAELSIVISRFVFSYEQALMGDLVRYWYAALFLFASAYTLFDEGHVRVDVLYAGFKNKTRGFVNAMGSILLGVTTCWVILGVGLGGKQAIINAPVSNFEITQSGAVGMFVKYQMAAFLAIFAITMMIQFVSYFFEAIADHRGQPGHVDHEPAAH